MIATELISRWEIGPLKGFFSPMQSTSKLLYV